MQVERLVVKKEGAPSQKRNPKIEAATHSLPFLFRYRDLPLGEKPRGGEDAAAKI